MTDQRVEPLIHLQGVSKRYRMGTTIVAALQQIDFTSPAGGVIALVGPNGSGKSTLLHVIGGMDRADEGQIMVAGSALEKLTPSQLTDFRRNKVGFVFQAFNLIPNLTALENVMLPLELGGFDSPKAKAKELLERVGLGERLSHTPRQLSGGEQQRVAIARAFASEPAILFADEPTGNLDNRTGADVSDLLMTLNREQGTTLVMVTHDERLAARCGRQFNIEAGVLTEPSTAPQPEAVN